MVSAYQSVPIAKVEELTGLRSASVDIFLRENPNLPYLFDPITQSVVFYEKNVPLYPEALSFYNIVKEKFEEKAKALLQETKEEDMDM